MQKASDDLPFVESRVPGFKVMMLHVLRGLTAAGIESLAVEYRGIKWRLKIVKDKPRGQKTDPAAE